MATLYDSAQQTLGASALSPATDFFGPGPMSSAMSARSRAILATQELQDAYEMRRMEDEFLKSELQRQQYPLQAAQVQSDAQNLPEIIAAQNTERRLRQRQNQYALDNFDAEVEEKKQRTKLETLRLQADAELYPLTAQAKRAELESEIAERAAFAPFVSILADQRARVARAQMGSAIEQLDAIEQVKARAPEITRKLSDAEKSLATPGVEDILLEVADDVALLPEAHPLRQKVDSALKRFDTTMKQKDLLRQSLAPIASARMRQQLFEEGVSALDRKDYDAFEKTLLRIDPSSELARKSKAMEGFVKVANDLQSDFQVPTKALNLLASGQLSARAILLEKAKNALPAVKAAWEKSDATGNSAFSLSTAGGNQIKFPDTAEDLVKIIETHGPALAKVQVPLQLDPLIRLYTALNEYQSIAGSMVQPEDENGAAEYRQPTTASEATTPDVSPIQARITILRSMLARADQAKAAQIQKQIAELEAQLGTQGVPQ